MSKITSELTKLRNIGSKLAGRLNEAGIFTEDDLRRVGAAEAHMWIKTMYPSEALPACYYLYSFEGALLGIDWRDRKSALRKQAGP